MPKTTTKGVKRQKRTRTELKRITKKEIPALTAYEKLWLIQLHIETDFFSPDIALALVKGLGQDLDKILFALLGSEHCPLPFGIVP